MSVKSAREPSLPNNRLIRMRERLLNWLVGARGTLNAAPTPTANVKTLPHDFVAALKALKSAAISEEGSTVDYVKLQQSAAYAEYQGVAASLRYFDPTTLLNREAQLAFWINVYNGLVLHAVIALKVQKSVSERLFGLAFFRKAAYSIGARRMSCEDVEHGILRENRGNPALAFLGQQFASDDSRQAWVIRPMDARIHFALNCASVSCPPIAVYEASQIEAQLDLAVRNFISSEVQLARGSVAVSQIFQWYMGDFGGEAALRAFLQRHTPDPAIQEALNHQKITYRRYNWALNHGVVS